MRCVVRSGAFSAFTKPQSNFHFCLCFCTSLLRRPWLASHTCWEATIA